MAHINAKDPVKLLKAPRKVRKHTHTRKNSPNKRQRQSGNKRFREKCQHRLVTDTITKKNIIGDLLDHNDNISDTNKIEHSHHCNDEKPSTNEGNDTNDCENHANIDTSEPPKKKRRLNKNKQSENK